MRYSGAARLPCAHLLPAVFLAGSFFAVAFLVAAFFFGFGLEPSARDALAWITKPRSRTYLGLMSLSGAEGNEAGARCQPSKWVHSTEASASGARERRWVAPAQVLKLPSPSSEICRTSPGAT